MTTINSQEDFLRALRENPEWKEAVRALILGEEKERHTPGPGKRPASSQ